MHGENVVKSLKRKSMVGQLKNLITQEYVSEWELQHFDIDNLNRDVGKYNEQLRMRLRQQLHQQHLLRKKSLLVEDKKQFGGMLVRSIKQSKKEKKYE